MGIGTSGEVPMCGEGDVDTNEDGVFIGVCPPERPPLPLLSAWWE